MTRIPKVTIMNFNRKKYARFSLRFNRKESGNTNNCYTVSNEYNESENFNQHQNREILKQRSIDRCREIAAHPEQFTELLTKGKHSDLIIVVFYNPLYS